jgi:succinate dehydrogenase / fumarate reductase iron-sulfur subunit
MSNETWKVKFVVHRQRLNQPARLEEFVIEISPEEYVLDGVEKIWAFEDRSLNFRHACHHSTCGACGMVFNGVENLTCITKIKDVTQDGGTIKVEPMRNFPILSDLVVDMGPFFARLDMVKARTIASLAEHPVSEGISPAKNGRGDEDIIRLVDCIECGLCISACPIAATDPDYLGPAILAAIQLRGLHEAPDLIQYADSGRGAWRCHSAYECTEACPSFVEPGWRIMDLRRQVVGKRISSLFGNR